jgi:diacylglycerol kinase
MEKMSEKKRFSIIARIRSANHAFRGLGVFIRTCHNAWGYLFFTALVIYLGIILSISSTEWILLILTIGFVFFAEIINTAIEIDIDLTSPNYHPYARDTKDVAAGATVLAVMMSWLIGFIIFVPKVLILIK